MTARVTSSCKTIGLPARVVLGVRNRPRAIVDNVGGTTQGAQLLLRCAEGVKVNNPDVIKNGDWGAKIAVGMDGNAVGRCTRVGYWCGFISCSLLLVCMGKGVGVRSSCGPRDSSHHFGSLTSHCGSTTPRGRLRRHVAGTRLRQTQMAKPECFK